MWEIQALEHRRNSSVGCERDLVCQPILGRYDVNIGNVLSPHDVRLMKTVMRRKKEGNILLLLCITVLLTATNTSSRARLRLGGCSVLAFLQDYEVSRMILLQQNKKRREARKKCHAGRPRRNDFFFVCVLMLLDSLIEFC